MQVTQRRRLEQYGKLKGRYRRLHTPRKKPENFDSLLVGYQASEGLLFAGKVGTGYSDKVRVRLSLANTPDHPAQDQVAGLCFYAFCLGVAWAGRDRLRAKGGGRGCDAPTCLLTIRRTSSLKNTGHRDWA